MDTVTVAFVKPNNIWFDFRTFNKNDISNFIKTNIEYINIPNNQLMEIIIDKIKMLPTMTGETEICFENNNIVFHLFKLIE